MANKFSYKGLFTNDVVVFRNGDRGIVGKNTITLQTGGFLERNQFKYTSRPYSLRFNEDSDYDIVKIYHNYENDVHFFNIADNKKYLAWAEVFPFPTLKNGDVVVLNNGNIYMKVDHSLVGLTGGYLQAEKYDINGKMNDELGNDYEWDIKKVYRNSRNDIKYYFFDLVKDENKLIWERC